jgi:hypothetical protein
MPARNEQIKAEARAISQWARVRQIERRALDSVPIVIAYAKSERVPFSFSRQNMRG